MPDADKLNITTMYLMGDAKILWRTQNADDVSAGRPRIDTWDKLINEMAKADGFGEKAKRLIEMANADRFGEGIH